MFTFCAIPFRTQNLSLFAKMTKNLGEFREEAKIDEMTINELAMFSKILPFYQKMFKDSGMPVDSLPRLYYGFYGFDSGLTQLTSHFLDQAFKQIFSRNW